MAETTNQTYNFRTKDRTIMRWQSWLRALSRNIRPSTWQSHSQHAVRRPRSVFLSVDLLEDRIVPTLSANVATAAVISPPTTGIEGSPLAFQATATDPNAIDYAAGFEFDWAISDSSNLYSASQQTFRTIGQTTDTFSYTPPEAGTYTLKVHAVDQNGTVGPETTASITVGDATLHIARGADITNGIVEGVGVGVVNPITVATVTDDYGGAPISDYTATIYWGDGTIDTATFANGYIQPDGEIQGSHIYAEEGTYYIGVVVTDVDGSTASLNITDAVHNQTGTTGPQVVVGDAAPAITANSPTLTTPANLPATNTGTFADFDDAVTITASQGTITQDSGNWTWSQSGLPVGGPYTINITATNADQSTSVTSFTVTVSPGSTNHPPVIVGPGPAVAVVGQSVPYIAAFTDADTTDTHTATIDWGDMSTVSSFTYGPGGAGTVNGAHTYATSGHYSITLTVKDNNGGVATSITSVNVVATNSITLVNGQLVIVGTPKADHIDVEREPHNLVTVEFNEKHRFETPLAGVQSIVVYGMGGGDHIKVSDQLKMPAFLFAGTSSYGGDAHIEGGGGSTVIVGGGGNDHLEGGDARSIVIGGKGKDHIEGDSNSDILVGGWTNYDNNLTALMAILAEWTRTDETYAQRVAHITGAATGGVNLFYNLNSTTVHDDGMHDVLATDGAHQDLVLAGTGDTVHT
jgi:PKD repeat protein